MIIIRRYLFGLVAVVLLSATAAPAEAQTTRGRDRALFGGGMGDVDQELSASSNLGITFLDPIGTKTGVIDGRSLSSTWFGQGSGALSYAAALPFLSANASIGGVSRYYRKPDRLWFTQALYNVEGATRHSWQLSPRTSLAANINGSFRPSYWALTASQNGLGAAATNLDPTLLLPPSATDLAGRSLGVTAGLSLRHSISRRISLVGDYQLTRYWTYGRPDAFDLLSQIGRADVEVELTRHLKVRGGYRYEDARNGPPEAPHVRRQGLDAGADYGRGGSIQLTRRTTLTVDGGASVVADTLGAQHYFVLGDASLNHEMGRSWKTSLSYSRSLDFSSLFQDPVLADTVTGDVGGLITDRLSFQAAAAYSRGTVGFVTAGHGLVRADAYAVIQSALTRYLALGASYAFYQRSIGSLVDVPVDLPRQSEDQVVTVFISTWAPLFHRARRPHATR
jgi:hypothetical protein